MFTLENNVLDVEKKYFHCGEKCAECGEKAADSWRDPLKAALNYSSWCFRSFEIDGFGAFEVVINPFQEEVSYQLFQNIPNEHECRFFCS